MQRFFNIIVLIFTGMLVSSCTVSNAVNKSNSDTLTFADITNNININSAKIKSFEGDGSIDFDSPENSNSASINIRRDALHDSIYARISGVFGITGAMVTLNPENFIFYNVQSSYVVKGESSRKNISTILKINLSYEELRNIICAAFVFDSAFKTDNINSNDVSYILTGNKAGISQKYYIDSKYKYVTKFISYDKSGSIAYEIEYNDYRLTEGIYFPMDVLFNVPSKKESIKLSYSSVNLNPEGLKFYFKIANNAEVYNWK